MPPRAGSACVSPADHSQEEGVAWVQCHHAVCGAAACGVGHPQRVRPRPHLCRTPSRSAISSPAARIACR
eukprot:3233901-Pleurochrysis_carterae.AAC.1